MREAIQELLKNYTNNIENRDDLEAVKRIICKKYKLKSILNTDILKEYRFNLKQGASSQKNLEKILRKRSVRTLSGVAPVAVLTKPYPCPGQCSFCPHESDVPTSYLSNEPAVMRAIRCNYDPYKQVVLRLRSLENNGHEPTKIEIIVIGGTWSYLPTKYKYYYIANCFKAANDYQHLRKNFSFDQKKDKFESKIKSVYKQNLSLNKLKKIVSLEQKKNEKAKYRIVGLTLETRPDYINEQELLEMRILACTRVEIGVQVVDDAILKLNQRGHGVREIAQATKLLRNYGFKITYHLMPALPGVTPTKDLKLFKKLFNDDRFQPDQIKFYPTVVTAGSLLYRWYCQGKYKPYSDRVLQNLIVKCKALVPNYVRIIRLVRDIPSESIIAGNKITNLRQIMKNRGVKCNCIRCREAKERSLVNNYKLKTIKYLAAGGEEYFISANSFDNKILYGFCRLRLSKDNITNSALVRELHVYGELAANAQQHKIQHSGLGKQLLTEAEKITLSNNINKIAVISGVGVRNYYRKLGYKLNKSYMLKKLS